jgi:hypothetical protein
MGKGTVEIHQTSHPNISANEVKEKVREATEAVGDFTKNKMAQYQHSFGVQLNALDRK